MARGTSRAVTGAVEVFSGTALCFVGLIAPDRFCAVDPVHVAPMRAIGSCQRYARR
ncbi:MAG: hypothetical protein ABJB12_03110 [Pseudomonadota bacterium]